MCTIEKKMKKLHCVLGLVLIIAVFSCEDEDIFGPVVATSDAAEVENSDAVLNGELLEIGTFPVTNLGFQISADSSMVANDVISVTSATDIIDRQIGPFSLQITDLQANTQYFFRAVAETEELPAFGEILSFKTTE